MTWDVPKAYAFFIYRICCDFSQPPPGESGQDDTTPKQEATREETSGGDSAQQEVDPGEAAAGGDVREELFFATMEFVPELGWSKKAIAAGTQNLEGWGGRM